MASLGRTASEVARCSSLTRYFHSSAPTSSHIGSTPIPIPANVKIDYPALSIPPDSSLASSSGRRILTVTGPLGSHSMLIMPYVILHPPSSSSPNLAVSVHDSKIKRHRSYWGFTRSVIDNTIKGVTEGYKLGIRLVGVGYRVTKEPIPPVFLQLSQLLTKKPRALKAGSAPQIELPAPTERLSFKLGYAHPVLINIPGDIEVNITSPTTMVLSGTDKQRLGIFAASIRRYRKPEPYRGKGIFVGDETIKLKEIKKK